MLSIYLTTYLPTYLSKAKKEVCSFFLLLIMLKNNFKKHLPFLTQKILPDKTLEHYISATINIRYKVRNLLEQRKE